MMFKICITYLVVNNDKPITGEEPSQAVVWKIERDLLTYDVPSDLSPDWCYDQLTTYEPAYAEYTIGIWAIDIEVI